MQYGIVEKEKDSRRKGLIKGVCSARHVCNFDGIGGTEKDKKGDTGGVGKELKGTREYIRERFNYDN